MLQKEIKNYIQNYRYNDLLKEGKKNLLSSIEYSFAILSGLTEKGEKSENISQTFDREGKKETTNFSRVNQQTTPFPPPFPEP